MPVKSSLHGVCSPDIPPKIFPAAEKGSVGGFPFKNSAAFKSEGWFASEGQIPGHRKEHALGPNYTTTEPRKTKTKKSIKAGHTHICIGILYKVYIFYLYKVI